MPNTSASGGFLLPSATPAPLEGQDLNRFIQQWVVGITGLDGDMVRPRFQSEPPNIPDEGQVWAAIGIMDQPSDTYPAVIHHGGDDLDGGYDELQRHEDLHLLCSFYDLGTNGQAQTYAKLLRDGIAIPQNREVLTRNDFGYVSVGQVLPVPSLLKVRWLYRVDLGVVLRREVKRVYAVENIASANGTLKTDDPARSVPITVDAP